MSRFALIVLPLAGVAFGAGASTLYWSGQMTHQFRAQAEWKATTDKAVDTIGIWKKASEGWEAVAIKNEAGWRECLVIARR